MAQIMECRQDSDIKLGKKKRMMTEKKTAKLKKLVHRQLLVAQKKERWV